MIQKQGFIKKNKQFIIDNFILFIIILILNRASILGIKVPFSSAFCFSLVLLNKNPFIISLFYLLSYIVFNFSFEGIVISLNVISALILMYLIYKIINKKISFFMSLIFYLIGQVGYVYFHINSISEVFITIVVIAVGLMFLYVSTQTLNAIFSRGLKSRFTLDENICFSILFIVLFSGVGNIYILGVSVTNLIALMIILLLGKSFGNIITIYLSILMGFGLAVGCGLVNYIALYVSYAAISLLFKDYKKIFVSVSVIFIDLIFGLFFNSVAYYSYLNLIGVLFVNIVYLLIPYKFFHKIKSYTYFYDGNLAQDYIIEGQKFYLKEKLLKLSSLFSEIQKSYKNLSIGGIDRKNIPNLLTEELEKTHCCDCVNYYKCSEKRDIKKAIEQLFELGLEKGKVNILDANNLITTECCKLKSLTNEINNQIINYFEYEQTIKTSDESKLVIANQIGGVGNIFDELSASLIGGERINKDFSKKVLNELTTNNVIVNEALVLEGDNGVEKVVLIIRNKDVLSPNIGISLKSVFKIEFVKVVSSMTKQAGWSVLCFIPAPKYAISVGLASTSEKQNNISGDNYSCVKLNNNKILFAISDGKGHGEKANNISSVALDLIENFYKSGFKSETIMSSVNNILLPAGEDNFATMDICIFDQTNGVADFIKFGSSLSVIKGNNVSRLIREESLPLGIIDKLKFNSKKVALKDQDIVILASDGVVDSFDDDQDYLNFINNERVINVQMLANNILEESISRNMKHDDDKTVLVFKASVKI